MTNNQISKDVLSQIDSQGNYFLFIREMNDHCKDASAVNRSDEFLASKSGNVHAKNTTRCWTFQV